MAKIRKNLYQNNYTLSNFLNILNNGKDVEEKLYSSENMEIPSPFDIYFKKNLHSNRDKYPCEANH